MKSEFGQSSTSPGEWSPLQNNAEAALSTPETEKKSSKKKRADAEMPVPPEKKSKEWRQHIDRPEIGQGPVISEGLIWLRAASDQARSRRETQVPTEPAEAATPTEATVPELAIAEPAQELPRYQRQPEQQMMGRIEPDRPAEPTAEQESPTESEPPTSEAEPEVINAESTEADQEPNDAGEHPQTVSEPAETEPGQQQYYEAPELLNVASPQAERHNPFESSYAPPPLPPDPSLYRRSFWTERSEARQNDEQYGNLPPVYSHEYAMAAQQPVTEQQAASWTRTETAPYASDTPPGLQRTPADVARAAWTGLFTGWYFGRRGKRKAMARARQAGYDAGRADAPVETVIAEPYHAPNAQLEQSSYQAPQRLEAEPMHTYPTQETSRVSVQPRSVETAPPAQTIEAPAAVQRAETSVAHMDGREVMRIAKTIKVEGIRLKDVYNAKRIDEAGLRAVVAEYLRGGDVRQRLTQEVINKEKSFEIDPLNRGRRNDNGEQSGGGGSLSRAADKAREQGSRLAESSKTTAQKAGKALAGAQQELIENTDSITWLSVTAVVIIWSLIAFLVFG